MSYQFTLADGVFTTAAENTAQKHKIIIAANYTTIPTAGQLGVKYKVIGSNQYRTLTVIELANVVDPIRIEVDVDDQIEEFKFIVDDFNGAGSIIFSDTERGESVEGYALYGNTGGMTPAEIGGALSDSVGFSDVDFIGGSKNLFDKTAVLIGYFLSGTAGNITANATYDVSDFIPVEASTTYTGRGVGAGMRFHAFYDSNKQFISGGSDSTAFSFKTSATTAFVRITVSHSDLNSFQFEKGAGATLYSPFGVRQLKVANGFRGKFLTTFGDSITEQGKWQPYVISSIGFATHSNKGIGGTLVSGSSADAMWQDSRINDINSLSDVIVFMGGTNDWAQSIPLGSITDTDPTASFYGGLNVVFEKLATRFPFAHIFANTTPYGELIDLSSRPLWADGATNNNGHTTHDYAECVRRAAERWGYYVIDVAGRAGINRVNINDYMSNDGGNLHPDDTDDNTGDKYNDSGARRIAQIVVSELSSFRIDV